VAQENRGLPILKKIILQTERTDSAAHAHPVSSQIYKQQSLEIHN
jgi:hypothetical protein